MRSLPTACCVCMPQKRGDSSQPAAYACCKSTVAAGDLQAGSRRPAGRLQAECRCKEATGAEHLQAAMLELEGEVAEQKVQVLQQPMLLQRPVQQELQQRRRAGGTQAGIRALDGLLLHRHSMLEGLLARAWTPRQASHCARAVYQRELCVAAWAM
jgi:hypothetical protein